jgi:hypothetical protein
VKVEYATCPDVTILGQQVFDPACDAWTFRKWNPEKLDVAFGEDTSVDPKSLNCCTRCVDQSGKEAVLYFVAANKSAD